MSASVSNYLFAMDERQRALRSTINNHAENGVGVPANSSARKCLFGVPDPVELQRKYDELHEEERKRGIAKWGFDFDTETPLQNSRYVWERVPSTSSVPKAYELAHLGPTERPEAALDVQEEDTDSTSISPQSPSSSTNNNAPTSSGTQPLITEHFRVKRRQISTGKHNNEVCSSSDSAEKRQCISSNPSSREGSP